MKKGFLHTGYVMGRLGDASMTAEGFQGDLFRIISVG